MNLKTLSETLENPSVMLCVVMLAAIPCGIIILQMTGETPLAKENIPALVAACVMTTIVTGFFIWVSQSKKEKVLTPDEDIEDKSGRE